MQLSAELAQAEHYDSTGDHQQALACLVAAVRKNDVEGITRLGKRLLIGDRAPLKPQEAVSFLVEAADKGGAEAPMVLSVLFALGLYAKQDWNAALECLAISAARGWQQSRGQLRVLGDANLAARSVEAQHERTWDELAASIDLQRWHSPPAQHRLSDSPLVCTYPHFAEARACEWLMRKAAPRLKPAEVYDAVKQAVGVNRERTNTSAVFNLLDTDLVNVLLQVRMAACVGMPLRHFEAATVLHYDVGQEIREHFDFVDPGVPNYEQQISQAGQRFITFLVYLNDAYEGGETEFPRVDISHKGKRGEGIFFVNAFADGKPDLRTLHAGRPPRSGEKWIVSQFIRSRQFF